MNKSFDCFVYFSIIFGKSSKIRRCFDFMSLDRVVSGMVKGDVREKRQNNESIYI